MNAQVYSSMRYNVLQVKFVMQELKRAGIRGMMTLIMIEIAERKERAL